VPQGALNVFFTGHSLTDNPVPDDFASIASGFGRSSLWNQQNIPGSPIRVRTRGLTVDDPTWSGYRTGKNRDGSNMDVVSELRYPQTIAGQRYGALVITERHDIASVLQYEDTVRYTRHFHERLIEGNPQAATYLYHAWLGGLDHSNPARWLDYERTTAPVWQCVASRINSSLANEGRSDRIHYMPTGPALVALVEQASYGYVNGITGSSVTETLNRLFQDDVHLTHLGRYFMSLVVYASTYRSSPIGAWYPSDITPAQAQSLQQIAWNAVSSYYANPQSPSMDSCQSLMRDSFCARFYDYIGYPSSTSACVAQFSTQSSSNPFYFNGATDRSYWFAAP
jgi:hypothetical protein